MHAWLARYKAREHAGNEQLVASADPLPPPDGGHDRGAGPGDAAPQAASTIYRCLLRVGLIQPALRRWRREDWKRWEGLLPL